MDNPSERRTLLRADAEPEPRRERKPDWVQRCGALTEAGNQCRNSEAFVVGKTRDQCRILDYPLCTSHRRMLAEGKRLGLAQGGSVQLSETSTKYKEYI
jgi:hypothetical protein